MVKIKGKLRFTRNKPYYSLSGNRIIKRKAVKEHICHQCYRTILPDEIEYEITGKSDFYEGFYTIYVCSKCWWK